jgi:hypothetical protein
VLKLIDEEKQTLESITPVFRQHEFGGEAGPKSVVEHSFCPSQYFLSRTPHQNFLLRFSLTPLQKWAYYPDGALAPGEGSYFVFPRIIAGKMVIAPSG